MILAKPLRALAGLALLLASCASTGPRDLTPIGVLEFRLLEPSPTPSVPVEEFEFKGIAQPLGPPHHFALAELGLSTDALGRPSMYWEVMERDRDALRELTGSNVGRTIAAVVDGRVVTMANIAAPLDGSAQIQGDFDLADVEAMILALTTE